MSPPMPPHASPMGTPLSALTEHERAQAMARFEIIRPFVYERVPLTQIARQLVRYGGCLAPHSALRHAIMPTPRQQGMDGEETKRGTPYWTWARLLKRVFALEMGTCPFCQRGVLRLIAVITQGEVIRKILRHLKLSADPPPIAPTRSRQAPCDWVV